MQQITQPVNEFGLSEDDLKKVLGQCLKPEEISGDKNLQAERVKELIRWFNRYADGNANPKWFHRHAFELVYYLATNNQLMSVQTANTNALKAIVEKCTECKVQYDLSNKPALKLARCLEEVYDIANNSNTPDGEE